MERHRLSLTPMKWSASSCRSNGSGCADIGAVMVQCLMFLCVSAPAACPAKTLHRE